MRDVRLPTNEALQRDLRRAVMVLRDDASTPDDRAAATETAVGFLESIFRIGNRRTATSRRIENEMAL